MKLEDEFDNLDERTDAEQLDLELFPGKKLSDLFKKIYENSMTQNREMTEWLDELMTKADGLTQIDDFSLLAMEVQKMFDTKVKNDEQLIKLAQVAQKIQSQISSMQERKWKMEYKNNNTDYDEKSEKEREALIEEAQSILSSIVDKAEDAKGDETE